MNPRKTTCRFCGRVLIFDDAKQSISHEAPECASFARLVATTKGTPGREA